MEKKGIIVIALTNLFGLDVHKTRIYAYIRLRLNDNYCIKLEMLQGNNTKTKLYGYVENGWIQIKDLLPLKHPPKGKRRSPEKVLPGVNCVGCCGVPEGCTVEVVFRTIRPVANSL